MAEPLFSLDGQSLITPYAVNNTLRPSPSPGNESDLLRTAEAEFAIVINIAMQRFDTGNNRPQTVRWLIDQLHDIRTKFGDAVWQQLIPLIQAHSSATILQQCPFTRWSYEKPRGIPAMQRSSTLSMGIRLWQTTWPAPPASAWRSSNARSTRPARSP